MAKRVTNGIAGESLVVAELSLLGHIATLTLKNTPNFDILASNIDGTRLVAIDVKSSEDGDRFKLGKKDEKWIHKECGNVFYVFVALKAKKANEENKFYVVNAREVAEKIKEYKAQTSNTLTRKGTLGNNNNQREFHISKHFTGTKNDFSILGL